MTAKSDLAGLQPQTLVEMFYFDPTNIGQPSTSRLRWHAGTTVDRSAIIWQGVEYQPYPVEAEGFEQVAAGKLPRPTLRAANIGGTLGAFLATMQDGLGARVTRLRTLGKYLDAINFPGGNPNADPTAGMPDELYFVARKRVANPIFIEFELAVPFDVAGIQLPRRQVIAGTCQWVYRSAECSYTGPNVTNDPVFPGLDPNGNDRCGKTLSSCKLRFTKAHGYDPEILKTSAFPASLLARLT